MLALEGSLRRQNPQKLRIEDENLGQKLNFIFNNLLSQNFDINYYLYAVILFNKVRLKVSEQASYTLNSDGRYKPGDFVRIFCVCFFIAFKMIEDNFKLFLEDMELLTGIPAGVLGDMEEGLMNSVFEFRVLVQIEEIKFTEKWLMRCYQCNNRMDYNAMRNGGFGNGCY